MDPKNSQHTDYNITVTRDLMFDVDRARAKVEDRYQGKYEYAGVPAIERGVYHEAARYYAVLEDSLRDLDFSGAEALLILDALNGFVAEERTYRTIELSIEDAINLNGAAERWGVDPEVLMRKIVALSPGHRMAIIDALERFCDGAEISSDYDTLMERLRMVGLLRG